MIGFVGIAYVKHILTKLYKTINEMLVHIHTNICLILRVSVCVVTRTRVI